MPNSNVANEASKEITGERASLIFTREDLVEQQSQLIDSIVDALSKYNLHRTEILDSAYHEGGSILVTHIEDERNALEDAYYELVRRQLDRNHQRYLDLIKQAKTEARELGQDIEAIRAVGEIIGRISNVINAIGRILIVTGV